MSFKLRLIPAAAAACVIAACGGGDAGAPPGVAPVTPAATPTSGVAVDDHLVGATVLCDSNGNGTADAGEVTTTTLSGGAFTFATGCSSTVVVTGGINADTGLAFKGVLKAPAGATVASPLTTLIAAGMSQAQVLSALGLPAGTDLLKTDPAATTAGGALVNGDLLKKTLAVQQLLQKTTEVFAGLGGASETASLQKIYSEVATSFGILLKGGGTLNAGTTVDSAVVASLVKSAADRVGQSATVDAAVKTAVAALNAESLGVVTAGSMKLQAEALLKSADADVTRVTSAQQSSTTISTFVKSNASQLTAAPTPATTTLGSTLTGQVAPPAPAPTDYIAVTGDALSLVNGNVSKSYSMADFQSDAGISVAWPLPPSMLLKVAVSQVGSYTLAANQKLTAAVAISETTASGKAEVLGYIDNVNVAKTAGGLEISVPTTGANSMVYGVSSDGKKKAVIDFGSSVAGVHNTLLTSGVLNSIVLGNVVNYAINQVSNDFTGIYSLRGKYKVTIVINGLPLRKADGSELASTTITVPTALDKNGAATASKSVTGPGLVGTISLTD